MSSSATTQEWQGVRMPVLFLGHGSPMNAIEENSFTKMLNGLGESLPRPRAILVVSAHWMTEGTWLTGMDNPKTIHDFYGFPKELFDVQYPAPGSPETAELTQKTVENYKINITDERWGLDHGTWSVLKHMYPKADVPVVQLSLYMSQPPEYHYKLGKELAPLRDQGIMIIGSGNIVHNLRKLIWETYAPPHAWAVEFDDWSKERLEARDHEAFVHRYHDTEAGRLSVPSMDHYYPLLYVLGASNAEDELRFEFEEIHNASISMRTLSLGRT